MVSVIVPIYNVEKYLAECLDSLAAQTFGDYEVVVVDDGSPDGSRAIADGYAAEDHRIVVVGRRNGGLGAARNTGVRHARGRYLAFLDSDDTLPPYALAVLVEKAETTGADITVGAMRRFNSTRTWVPGWTSQVHLEERVVHRIDDFPPLLRNLYTCNKLFRRDFWTRQDLWFREGVAYEDQPLVTQLYASAATIAVVREPVYDYRSRDDKSSISQQTASLRDLRDRITAWRVSREALRGVVSPTVYDGWLQTLFDAHFHWYLTSRGTVDDTYWRELREAIVEFTGDAPKEVWDATMPDKRVLLELARQDRRADAQELVRLGSGRLDQWEAEARDDGILLRLPFLGDPLLDEQLFVLRPEQLRLGQSVETLRWVEDDDDCSTRLSVAGWAYIRKVDLSQHESTVTVVLRNARSGQEWEIESKERPEAAFPPPVEDPWCDYSPGTFHVVLPMAEAAAAGQPGDSWSLLLRVSAAGLTVTEPVTQLVRSGSAGAVPAAILPDRSRIMASWRIQEPLRFRHVPLRVEVTDAQLDGRTLTGTLGGTDADAVRRLEAVCGDTVVSADLAAGGAARTFRITLPSAPSLSDTGHVRWLLQAFVDEPQPVGVSVPEKVEQSFTSRSSVLVLQRGRNGNLVVGEWSLGAEAHGVDLTPDGVILVTGTVLGAGVNSVVLRARSKKSRARGPEAPVLAGGRFEARLQMTHEVFRFGALPLPTGEHDFSLLVRTDDGAEHDVDLRMSARLSGSLPIRIGTEHHEGRLVRGPRGVLRASLVRPLRDARGRFQQRELRTAGARGPAGRRGVLMRSYFGEQATDNGLSIQKELRRRGCDLPVYWAVQDHSVAVPGDGIPVVVNSREWYDVLGSVTYYLDNMFQPEYHRKPDGQVIVETFHGYPFKTMGRRHWANLQLSQTRIDSYAERAKAWDYLVSPATYATSLLTDAFGYSGEVLEIGYPRNDVLLSAEAPEVRAMTRASLGITDGQTAVLYAPTFRDYLASGDSRAIMADFLDFRAATKTLGEEFVLMVRGHAFNARSRQRVGDLDGIVDVTDYPEVSDLYLAADVAVVDYSSLRFDFGVTGKPMIFNVPDLQRYQETRGWLFDFEPTAPGPLVSSTEAVVAELRDLPGVRERYATQYAEFRATYLSLEDGNAGRRFVDAVFAPRGDA
jgi:CDP-glycerol glycerophosphotransferase